MKHKKLQCSSTCLQMKKTLEIEVRQVEEEGN